MIKQIKLADQMLKSPWNNYLWDEALYPELEAKMAKISNSPTVEQVEPRPLMTGTVHIAGNEDQIRYNKIVLTGCSVFKYK